MISRYGKIACGW